MHVDKSVEILSVQFIVNWSVDSVTADEKEKCVTHEEEYFACVTRPKLWVLTDFGAQVRQPESVSSREAL